MRFVALQVTVQLVPGTRHIASALAVLHIPEYIKLRMSHGEQPLLALTRSDGTRIMQEVIPKPHEAHRLEPRKSRDVRHDARRVRGHGHGRERRSREVFRPGFNELELAQFDAMLRCLAPELVDERRTLVRWAYANACNHGLLGRSVKLADLRSHEYRGSHRSLSLLRRETYGNLGAMLARAT